MSKEKFTSIIAISEISNTTINEARKLFFAYKDKNIVIDGQFDDDIWGLSDEYARYSFDFSISNEEIEGFVKRFNISKNELQEYIKVFVVCQMGKYALITIQRIIKLIKKISYSYGEVSKLEWKEEDIRFINMASEFFSLLPTEGREEVIIYLTSELEDIEFACNKCTNARRTLAEFESYFRFDEILKKYWNEETDEEAKLFYFPIWMWWNVSGVLPLRPREFVLTPRDCITEINGKLYLSVRRNKIKGTNKTKNYKLADDYEIVKYVITEKLAAEINWYINKTNDLYNSEIDTLFETASHYSMWERNAPYTSRYYTYINLRTCLRYFFNYIIADYYGYTVLYDNKSKKLKNTNEIEYLHLGDTRHIALINLIAEGATPMVAMMLAGHDNPEMSSHYYSNISTLIECRTYRQYKKMINGKQTYSLSGSHANLSVKDYTMMEDGSRCYSEKIKNDDYSDCYNAVGPAGEIGFCENCKFYRAKDRGYFDGKELYKNRIYNECLVLDQIVKKVRAGKGEKEEILSSLMRLRDEDLSYQQYLLEKMEEDNGKGKDL